MRQIRVLIVDDDKNSLYRSRAAMERLVEPGCIYCAQNAEAVMDLLAHEGIELAFLDIDMADTSGFSIADYLRENYPQVRYVFLTGYVDFAARSYDYEPLDFLTKPIDLMRLQKTLERYESREKQSARDYARERVALDTSEGFLLLPPEEIAFVGKENRMVKIHCRNGRTYLVRHSMDDMEKVFSDFGFFRIHQSYMIPLANIVSVRPARFGRTYEAVLSDETCLPVSREKYQKLRDFLASRGVQFL